MNDDDALRDLRDLIGEGGWRPLPGIAGVLIYLRPWPDDSVDSLAVSGPAEVVAERSNAAGRPVWRRTGALDDVVAELRELPPPDALDAPRKVLPALGDLA